MSKKLLSALLWGIVFILAGVMMLLNSLGIIEFSIRDWWPVLFIVVGLNIVIDAIAKREK